MQNLAMQQMLRTGEALDIRREGQLVREGLYQLKRFNPDKDYCDPLIERWIWSVGKNFFDDRIMASTDARFSGDPNWDCLFLR